MEQRQAGEHGHSFSQSSHRAKSEKLETINSRRTCKAATTLKMTKKKGK
jgi:hypothetical protein